MNRYARRLIDVFLACCCVAAVLSTATTVWGSLSPTVWFSWHPTMMVLSFGCLMPLGRWSYKADPFWGADEKLDRRKRHAICMALSGLAATIGFLGIYVSHVQKKTLFGYRFATKEWAPTTHIAHCIFGYVILIAVFFQALVGMRKYNSPLRILTFHGNLGKYIIVGGVLNILIALWFFSWTPIQKVRIAAFLAFTTCFAVTPWTPSDAAEEFSKFVDSPAPESDVHGKAELYID